ncbi:MAG: YHS domain-containing (seleno)protein [Alphaproteobacteria bacterium]|nr:YHS domain-containing (seleno)protein [Alphaproteobacteria bacterium]
MIRHLFLALALAGATAAAPAAFAEKAPVYTSFASDLAVGGFDPVAYFQSKGPVEGSKTFEYTHNGAKWRFANAENLAAFKSDPARYAPQYGGYCAWAASQGYTAKGDPKYWKVVNGKLYLNYNSDIQTKWEKDVPGFITKADANWPKVLAK